MKARLKFYENSRFIALLVTCLFLGVTGNVFADLETNGPKAGSYESEVESVIQVTQKLIRGKVTDEKGEALPGVNIVEKGTTNGVITDIEGEYSITVPAGSTIIYSFIGFQSQEIVVINQEVINVKLKDESLGLDEVVVTAMGVVSEKKNLNFAVQAVDADQITRDKQTNFVNSLQGRVAGVEVSGAGGSPNASTQMLIRGASSIDPGMDNEPIFILNGMHVAGGAAKAAEINPEDIESVTILKGAAAAALYGSEAANGAIIITTKSGQAGILQATLSATFQFDEVANLPELQDQYLRGGLGVYRNEESMGGWGPLRPQGMKTYDNVGNFLQTGVMQKYDLSLSGGSERFTSYASLSYTDHEGVMPNDYLNRFTLLAKSEYKIRDNLSVDLMANISNKKSRGGDTMGSVYRWPIDDDMSYYRTSEGGIRWIYKDSKDPYDSPLNPNWRRYEDYSVARSYRTLIQGAVKWSPIKDLKLTGRMSYDLTNSESEDLDTPRWPDPEEEAKLRDLEYLGYMKLYNGRSYVINMTALAQYSKDITEDIKLEAMVGTDFKRRKGQSSQMEGYDFIVPSLYSFNNLKVIREIDEVAHSRKELVGVFGEIRLDYKGIAHVGATLRNDISSTLADDRDSYHYPSFSGGLVFTELFKINSPLISFGKIRGNWAKVGKDTNEYKQHNYLKNWAQHPDGGYGVDPVSSGNRYLDPEMMSSWEIGADLRLFNDRTRLDIAYYSTFIDGQIVTVRVPVTTGNVLQTRNEGDISNKGVEISLNQKLVALSDFKWDLTANFAHNEGTVGDLPGDVKEVYHYAGQVGVIRPASIEFGPVFGITGTDYERTEDGQVIIRPNGTPIVGGTGGLLIGNREPDFTMGIENSFQYKNVGLSFLFDIRKGGDVLNGTLQYLMSNGMASNLEDYRNREIIVEGVVEQADGSFVPNITPVVFDQTFYNNYYAPVSTNFIEDGSYIRLATLSLSYDISKLSKSIGIEGLMVSVTGRNLFLWSNYSGSDPLINHTGNSRGAGTFGIDYLRIPNTRSVSFNIKANF